MAPRRAQRKGVADGHGHAGATASTSTVPPLVDSSGPKIAEALQQWSTSGEGTIKEVLVSQLQQAISSSATIASIPLSISFITLLSSDIEPTILADFIPSVVEGQGEEAAEVFYEVLVESVELLEEDKEDCNGLPKTQDQDSQSSSTSKGLAVIKLLLQNGTLPPHIPALLLTPDYLVDLGLHPIPHHPPALRNAFVKRNTALFFKQYKYNLLRESSEGFSGLIVLLTGPDSLLNHPEETDADRQERAKRVWSKVMSLIGYFNLSPPRVLDVILEIASCHIAAHWRFFLNLLEASPWGAVPVATDRKGKGKAVDNWAEDEIASIGEVLNHEGDRVLAQVLGFKFGFYQKPEGGDTPVGLTYVAALLIKHGFISLADLLPFLAPDDTEMDNVRSRWSSSVNSRSGPSNALSNSVLLDDDAPATANMEKAEPSGPPPKPPPEQRIELLQALLALGDLPPSLFFLAKFPWTAQSRPIIADLILRNVSYALEGFYRTYAAPKDQADDEDLDLHISAPTASHTQKEAVPTLYSPVPPETSTRIFEFFYPYWHDDIELWSSIDDIHSKGLRWLGLIRGLGGRDAAVMVKLCRIGATFFTNVRKEKEAGLGISHAKSKDQLAQVEPTPEEMRPWLDIIRTILLPSLSASGATAAFDIELWSLIKFFPYTVRYALYGEWRDSTCSFTGRNPCLVAAQAAAECTRETQKALRRVTSSSTSGSASAATANERYSARFLAKLSHGNPCALWSTAMTQVKAYPNIGQAIVDAGRYMTQLSFDVATFVMLDTLSDDRQARLNEMGTGVAAWLERLSQFVGDFNRRYANMDLDPVLQYIINRLMRGDSADLIILERLMSVMSGAEPVPNDGVSDTQLQAYAGGRQIIREAFQATRILIAAPVDQTGDKPKEAPIDKGKSTKKSLPRFVSALRETKLAMPIWIALAQTRQGAVDRMTTAPIKAMNLVQDSCHTAFIQYGDLLAEQLSADEHVKYTPDLAELVNDFGLDHASAFQILRPRLNAEIERVKSEEKAAVQRRLLAEKQALSQRNGSPAKEAATLPASVIADVQAEAEDIVMEEEAIGEKSEASNVPLPKSAGGKQKHWWPSALTVTMQQARKLLPREANEVMSAPFFVIFWHLTMSEIAFSLESYDQAIAAIQRHESIVSGWRVSAKDKSEQQAELARLKIRAGVLSKERDAQQALVNGPFRRRLRSESAKWFGKTIVEKTLQLRLAAQLHQYCFYPRAILTPADAVFVAKFIRVAHDLGTLGFSTLFAYNNFFSDNLAACIFSCTESEARNLGRCLAAILADLDGWHADEGKYRREALGLPDKPAEGEQPTPLPGMLFRPKAGDEMRPMSWQQFRNFYAKCHNTFTRALVSCWSEAEFMHNKNAIVVGLQVIKHFPVMDTNGKAIESAIKKLHAGENGEITNDLKLLSTSFLTGLKKRQQTRPYVPAASFHSAAARAAVAATPAKAAPTGPKAVDSSDLNGKADPQVANGDTSSITAATGPPVADPKVLRQKLEEGRSRSAAKEEAKMATEPVGSLAKTETPGSSPARTSDAKGIANQASPPAGPRLTRSSTNTPSAPSGPANSTRFTSDSKLSASSSAPAGPRGLPERVQSPLATSSMGPPAELSVDEARAAARAKKFGIVAKPTPTGPAAPPSNPNATTSAPPSTAPVEVSRAKSPTPSSRRTSPAPRTHRSGSTESRASERSRRDRDRRERDSRDEGRERKDERDTRKATTDDDRDRKRQEDLLQSRHDRLATVEGEERRDTRDSRRSSRDTGGHRRESEKEREERKAKEKEKERPHRDETGTKRKRDEEPRRIDNPDRRDDRRDRDRDRDRRDDRHKDRDDRDKRERHRDDRDRERDRSGARRDSDRDREREKDRPRRDRETRDPRDAPPPRDSGRPSGETRPAPAPSATNGDRTPKRDAPRELLPPRPSAEGDRIVEPPRNTRSSATAPAIAAQGQSQPGASRLAHALPPRPGAAVRPPTSNLAQRMGPAPTANEVNDAPRAQRDRSPAPRADERASASRAGDTTAAARGEDEQEGRRDSAEPRKRTLEETGPPSREESPGASKRVKIDRDKARGRREPGGVGRMLQAAMGSREK